MDAFLVLGQEDFTSEEPGLSANKFRRPSGLAYDRNNHRLFVSDNGNRRVLVFDARPEVDVEDHDLASDTEMRVASGIVDEEESLVDVVDNEGAGKLRLLLGEVAGVRAPGVVARNRLRIAERDESEFRKNFAPRL